MGIFRTNRRLLDRLVMRPDGTIDPADAAAVRTHLLMMMAERRKPGAPVIPYSDHHLQVAYIFNYFAMHTSLVEDMVLTQPGLLRFCQEQIAKTGTLKVCAFGGGPGSETLALARVIDQRPELHGAVLEVLVVDREKHWSNSFMPLVDEVRRAQQAKYRGSHTAGVVTVHPAFVPFDLFRPEDFLKCPMPFRDQSLIILNYVISEVCDLAQLRRLADVLTVIGSMVGVGARLLVIDRLGDTEKIDTVLQMTDYWNVTSSFPKKRYTLNADREDKIELLPYMQAFGDPHMQAFGDWRPSLKRDIRVVVAAKMFS